MEGGLVEQTDRSSITRLSATRSLSSPCGSAFTVPYLPYYQPTNKRKTHGYVLSSTTHLPSHALLPCLPPFSS
jgi:hypothetical protein